jgi:RNA polymerase sigma-70 factor (ECF subfamily)
MSGGSFLPTSVSLLERIRDDAANQDAWNDFIGRYSGPIYAWCRQWKLQEADAQDVTQAVLLRLAERLKTFQYDPAKSFRAYLKTITHYAWQDFLESRHRPGGGAGGSVILEVLDQVQARDDLVLRLQDEFDAEILDEAVRRVRQRVAEHTWEAFRLMAMEGLSGAEVAQQLNLKVLTAFKAKSKVQQMLQDEIKALNQDES